MRNVEGGSPVRALEESEEGRQKPETEEHRCIYDNWRKGNEQKDKPSREVTNLEALEDLNEVDPNDALVDVLAALNVPFDLHGQVSPSAVLHHDAQIVAVWGREGGKDEG